MKKNLLKLTAFIAILATGLAVQGQNLVAGGDMESETGWDTVSVIAATHPIELPGVIPNTHHLPERAGVCIIHPWQVPVTDFSTMILSSFIR